MIYLKQSDYERMIDYCKNQLPYEACGLLGGEYDVDGNQYVRQIYFLENTKRSCHHFLMNPKEQFAAIRDLRGKGYEVLGNFHSHPDAPAKPSKEDLQYATDEHIFYGIVSLMNEKQPEFLIYQVDATNNICFVPAKIAE